MKTCSKCEARKFVTEFYRRGDGTLRSQCKECERAANRARYSDSPPEAKERAKKWREDNPDRVKDYKKKNRRRYHYADLIRKYGVSESAFKAMMKAQDGCCDICFDKFHWETNAPNVDHDHRGGAVRGLLCRRCNSVLGLVKDNPEMLRVAAAYLDGKVWCFSKERK